MLEDALYRLSFAHVHIWLAHTYYKSQQILGTRSLFYDAMYCIETILLAYFDYRFAIAFSIHGFCDVCHWTIGVHISATFQSVWCKITWQTEMFLRHGCIEAAWILAGVFGIILGDTCYDIVELEAESGRGPQCSQLLCSYTCVLLLDTWSCH